MLFPQPDTDRRGFLRSLANLPLIGGGVSLLGNPTSAAEPITDALLDSYNTWLFHERRALLWQRAERNAVRYEELQSFVSSENAGFDYHTDQANFPGAVGRAAVVLSAVGCDWRKGC